MDGTGVELHAEDDISRWTTELLVITLQLGGKGATGREDGQVSGSLLSSKAHPKPREREVTDTAPPQKKRISALWETSRTEEERNSLELWGMFCIQVDMQKGNAAFN